MQNKINNGSTNISTNKKLDSKKEGRRIVVPGEVIVSGFDWLASEGSMREDKDIIAIKYGIVNIENNLVKVVPIGGVYMPRVGNIVIGQVIDILFNGWLIDIFAPHQGFLPITEISNAVEKEDVSHYYDVNDLLVLKVKNVQLRSVTLTMKDKGLGKINSGLIVRVGPTKVARIIGKQGSMVNTIKEATNTKIIVGQNGLIWIKGENAENELLAKEAIEMVAQNPLLDGLTDKVKEFLEKKIKQQKESK